MTIAASTATAAAGTPAAVATSPHGSPAPDEVLGHWTTTLPDQERVTLLIDPSSYFVSRPPSVVRGHVISNGDLITFVGSTACPAAGTYTWTRRADKLTFESVSEACPGRAEILKDQTYRPLER